MELFLSFYQNIESFIEIRYVRYMHEGFLLNSNRKSTYDIERCKGVLANVVPHITQVWATNSGISMRNLYRLRHSIKPQKTQLIGNGSTHLQASRYCCSTLQTFIAWELNAPINNAFVIAKIFLAYLKKIFQICFPRVKKSSGCADDSKLYGEFFWGTLLMFDNVLFHFLRSFTLYFLSLRWMFRNIKRLSNTKL